MIPRETLEAAVDAARKAELQPGITFSQVMEAALTAALSSQWRGMEERERVPVAQAIIKARVIFESSPHLTDSDSLVPGCGYMTWRELHTLVSYASNKFDINNWQPLPMKE